MNCPAHRLHSSRQFGLRDKFARNLRLWRHARALSQAELAKAAGLSRPFLSSIERGHFSVSLETLDDLASALGVDPAMLIGQLNLAEHRADLRELRESRGMSQSQLATASGLSRFHIARMETGKSTPGAKAKQALAVALGVPASSL